MQGARARARFDRALRRGQQIAFSVALVGECRAYGVMHPEYPCAHCICGATLAAVVETLFDTADVAEVTLTSATAPGVTHRWTNLWALSKEVSEARIWAGFHYRFSTRAGEDMGRKVGAVRCGKYSKAGGSGRRALSPIHIIRKACSTCAVAAIRGGFS